MRNQLRAFWAAALIALPFSASADLSAVPSGKYTLDRSHGYITFTYSHLGFSNPRVGFNSFDTVLCSLSVEYLTSPLEVFNEVRRVLKPGGAFINSFSERWFPTKAVTLWTRMHPFERIGMVLDHYIATGFADLQTESVRGHLRPENDRYRGMSPFSDPVYVVAGRKP